MIDPEVKLIDWVDDFPQNDGSPEILAITATIGLRDETAADLFQVLVCNPDWIAAEAKERFGVWPRGYLIVDVFDADHIKCTIQALADTFKMSRNWELFAERMNRYLLWEYEDHNDYQGEPLVPRPD